MAYLDYTTYYYYFTIIMNYYYIREKDQQYSNCLYLASISNKAILNDSYRTFTIPGSIEYTFSQELYDEFKKESSPKYTES